MGQENNNPFEAPESQGLALVETVPHLDLTDAEITRLQCLATEGNVIGIGVLSMVAGALLLVWSGIAMMNSRSLGGLLHDILLLLCLSLILVVGGVYTRKLHKAGRVLLCLAYVCVIALSYRTYVGVVFPLLFTMVLWGKHTALIFTEYYRVDIIGQTPHLKAKRGNVIYGCLFVMGVSLMALVFLFYFSYRR